ncbi:MAG TPA: glycosyltransferase family 1 protein [Candidatus Binataceae bacterium]|nr:glycosyltransferase family 1 protein [Candidatus Binataceae bacterium]
MSLSIGYDGKFLWQGKSFGSRSGHGVHARHLLESMTEQSPRSDFVVFALDTKIGMDLHPNCKVVTLSRLARSSFFRNLIAYPLTLRHVPVDVMLAFSTLPSFVACKTVLLLADIFWLANPGWLPPHIAIPRTIALRRSVKRADRIITTTEFSRREIMRILKVPAEKIVVVPHGTRTEFAERLAPIRINSILDQYHIKAPYILSLNDIHPRKNLGGLVEAFNRLKARTRLPHQLVIGGRTLWPYPEFHQRVARSRFARDIRVLGYVPTQDVLALYQGSDLFVYPSFYEGWGLQVHEAMIAGVPIAVANNTTLPEIGGNAVESFDPHNPDDMSHAMEKVLVDRDLRDSLITKGYERVKLYSWQDAANRTLSVCYDLVS